MKIIATSLIITFIITLIIAVIIIQENTITTTQIQAPKITTQSMIPSTTSGGGSTNTNTNTATGTPSITNMRLTTSNQETEIYWEVTNGIGCCNGYDCNAQAWKTYCLEPFKLYDIYLDQTKIEITNNLYTCETTTPYNYQKISNIPRGIHTITINQKECTTNIVDTETIMFEIR